MAATDIEGRRRHVRDPRSERRTQISAIDISRAYFNASMEEGSEPTYVCPPPEHPGQARGQCGLLLKHMYGTRAAADGWQQEYSSFMKKIGFSMSLSKSTRGVSDKQASNVLGNEKNDEILSKSHKTCFFSENILILAIRHIQLLLRSVFKVLLDGQEEIQPH